MDRDTFVTEFGGVFEHSRWVAEETYCHRPFQSVEHLSNCMNGAVLSASHDAQLKLLCAHPDLGTRACVTESSAAEQQNAGLKQLNQAEYDELLSLNAAYRSRFGFPFIFAVKGRGKTDIIEALRRRTTSVPEPEFQEALRQVFRIARFRLEDL